MALSLLVLDENSDIRQQAYVDEPDPTPIVVAPTKQPTSILQNPTIAISTTAPTTRPSSTIIPSPTNNPTEQKAITCGALGSTQCCTNLDCSGGTYCDRPTSLAGTCRSKVNPTTSIGPINASPTRIPTQPVEDVSFYTYKPRITATPTLSSRNTISNNVNTNPAPTGIITNTHTIDNSNSTTNRLVEPTRASTQNTNNFLNGSQNTDTGSQTSINRETGGTRASNQSITQSVSNRVTDTRDTATILHDINPDKNKSSALTQSAQLLLGITDTRRSTSSSDTLQINQSLRTTNRVSEEEVTHTLAVASTINAAYLKTDSARNVGTTTNPQNRSEVNVLVENKGQAYIYTIPVTTNHEGKLDQNQLTSDTERIISDTSNGFAVSSNIINRAQVATANGHRDLTVSALRKPNENPISCLLLSCISATDVEQINRLNTVDAIITHSSTGMITSNAQNLNVSVNGGRVDVTQYISASDADHSIGLQFSPVIEQFRATTDLSAANTQTSRPVIVSVNNQDAQVIADRTGANLRNVEIAATALTLSHLTGATGSTLTVTGDQTTRAFVPNTTLTTTARAIDTSVREIQSATVDKCSLTCQAESFAEKNRISQILSDIAMPGLSTVTNQISSPTTLNVNVVRVTTLPTMGGLHVENSGITVEHNNTITATIYQDPTGNQSIHFSIPENSPLAPSIRSLESQIRDNPSGFADQINYTISSAVELR